MKVRFLKTHILHSAKPFKEGMEMNFNPKVAQILYSKGVVEIFQKRYRVLYNFIDARNTLHIKWLKWCGFTFIQKHYDYGYEKRLFYEFVRI